MEEDTEEEMDEAAEEVGEPDADAPEEEPELEVAVAEPADPVAETVDKNRVWLVSVCVRYSIVP